MLSLEFNQEQMALADSVRRFCEHHCDADVVRGEGVPKRIWQGLAELGVLGLATPEGGGGAVDVAAAMDQLGRAVCPGPLVTTFFAAQAVDSEERARISSGELFASVGAPPLVPWAAVADVFVEVAGERMWRARPVGDVEPIETLGREPWGRVEFERTAELDGFKRATSLANVSLAAYLVGAGRMLIESAAAYAADRVQFGQPIGEFQAVAHPLADVHLRVMAAARLTRVAAFEWDSGDPDDRAVTTAAATARLSATEAALASAYQAHQTFGAMGFTEEGPVGYAGQRIRQVSLLPPDDAHVRAAVLARYDL